MERQPHDYQVTRAHNLLPPETIGPCSQCDAQVPARLGCILIPSAGGAPIYVCAACIAISELRTAQDAAEHDGPWLHRCERCQRRGRALDTVHGFKLCAECAGHAEHAH